MDENIVLDQRLLLTKWKIHFRRIIEEFGRRGAKDDDIIPLLHRLRRPTFFTRDIDFRSPTLCHQNYCLVYLDVRAAEAAQYIRRVLRHPALKTSAKRMGSVIVVNESGLRLWRLHADESWLDWER